MNKEIINSQKNIWDKNWQKQFKASPELIINSKFTKEAFKNFKNFITHKDTLILETGFGTGRLCCLLAKEYPKARIIGIDTSSDSFKVAQKVKNFLKIKNVFFKKGNLFTIPFKNDLFDVVFNEGVIEHFPLNNENNYNNAIKEMIRVTKEEGKIIVAVPNWYNFPHTFYKWFLKKTGQNYVYGYEKSFKHKELFELFEKNGLVNIEMSGFYPAYGFYRLSGRFLGRIFKLFGIIIDASQILFDAILKKKFSNFFGFEILIKGIKKSNSKK